MTIAIKCERMTEGWDYDVCIECSRFSVGRSAKGQSWRCKLNSGSAAEKREFYTIWAEDYLIARGVMDEKWRSAVAVEYVGKKNGKKNLRR